jgi:DNA (cytosine-5)-methyltransferase 1
MKFVRSLICLPLSASSICSPVQADLARDLRPLSRTATAPFRIGISVEKEASAHRTLTLRAFLREYMVASRRLAEISSSISMAGLDVSEPDWSAVDAEAWRACHR